MNVYDFDNTIYDGESLYDFFIFSMKKKPKLIRYFPLILYTLIFYKLRMISIEKFYKLANKMSSVFQDFSDENVVDQFVEEFWQKNRHKLKPKYLEMLTDKDVIITGSPRMLISGIMNELAVLPSNIVCSELNLSTGCFDFICLRENKVSVFKEKFPNAVIDKFYTDSLNDIPMMKLAKCSYLVKGYKEPKLIDPKINR